MCKRKKTYCHYDLIIFLPMKTKIDFPIFQEWGDEIESVWPDLTVEDRALWTDVGLTFKMRRRYRKFVLLYYVPRSSSLFFKFNNCILIFSAFFALYLLGGHS